MNFELEESKFQHILNDKVLWDVLLQYYCNTGMTTYIITNDISINN